MMIIIRFMTLLFSTIAFKINRNDQFIIDDDGLRRVWHGYTNILYSNLESMLSIKHLLSILQS